MGHASVRDQLEWCREAAIKHAIITHCGSQIVREGRAANERIKTLAKERGVDAPGCRRWIGRDSRREEFHRVRISPVMTRKTASSGAGDGRNQLRREPAPGPAAPVYKSD
jgi:hypothetical protein